MTATAEQVTASGRFMEVAERAEIHTFYVLADEWQHLVWLLEDPNSDPEEIQQELQRVAGDIRQKAHGLAVVVQSLDKLAERQKFEADQLKAEVERLAAKAKATAARSKALREYGLACMQAIGERRIETGVFTLSVRLNPERVNVLDADLIPPEFWRQPPIPKLEPDLIAIKAHTKTTGEVVAGTEVVRGQRLEIQ